MLHTVLFDESPSLHAVLSRQRNISEYSCLTVTNIAFLILTVLFRESSLRANPFCTGMFLRTDFVVLEQISYIDLLSYCTVHCHIMANVQFCKTCVSVMDKVQRHMHIFTRSKCHRQAILSQVLLLHLFQLYIQLNSLSLLYQLSVSL